MSEKTPRELWLIAHMDVAVQRNNLRYGIEDPEVGASDIIILSGRYDDSKTDAMEKYEEYLSREDKGFM